MTPTYLAVKLYNDHLGAERLAAEVSGPTFDTSREGRGVPYLDIAASRSGDGRQLYLKAVHTSPSQALKTTITVTGASVPSRGTIETLNADSLQVANTFANPQAVRVTAASAPGDLHGRLPAHSVSSSRCLSAARRPRSCGGPNRDDIQAGLDVSLPSPSLCSGPVMAQGALAGGGAGVPQRRGSSGATRLGHQPAGDVREATFSAEEIDREFGWAEAMGINTMRVFLHDLLWQHDAAGFRKRLDQFLGHASHTHRPMLVLFDSRWDRRSPARPSRRPRRAITGLGIGSRHAPPDLTDAREAVVGVGRSRRTIASWPDVWNEPDNTNSGSYGSRAEGKVVRVTALLPQRSRGPARWVPSSLSPAASGASSKPRPTAPPARWRIQLGSRTSSPSTTTRAVLQAPGRLVEEVQPVICRVHGPVRGQHVRRDPAHREAGGRRGDQLGFVAGKTQTFLPWDPWRRLRPRAAHARWVPSGAAPDGTPYDGGGLIRQLTGKQ